MNTNEITHPAPDLTAAESAELLTPSEVIEDRHVDRLNELLAEQRDLAQLLGCEPGEVRERVEGLLRVTYEIVDIMKTYREQSASRYDVDTPGGLEHMGDVWSLLGKWDRALARSRKAEEES